MTKPADSQADGLAGASANGLAGAPANGQPQDGPGALLDSVRQAALDLLGALPDRPQRLTVRVADVAVELDWQAPVTAPVLSGPVVSGQPQVISGQVLSGQPQAPGPQAAGAEPAAERPAALHYVCSPSVGTFYRAPEPGSPPFASEGKVVRAGQQVAIVEAMKLMLPVEADRPGQVVEVLVQDGQPVEYGERLLALAPAGAV